MKKGTKKRFASDFNKLYYENHDDNFKGALLPTWIKSYSQYIRAEIDQDLPEYYKEFKQGTIVMIDFGVRIGSEISGNHFGITLTNKDDQFQRTVLIAPLTSHEGRNHISLGYELMQNMHDRFFKKYQETTDVLEKMEVEMEVLKERVKNSTNKLEADFFTQNNITVTEKDRHFTVTLPGRSDSIPINVAQREFINKIKKYNYSNYEHVNEFVQLASELLDKADSFIPLFNKANQNIQILRSLVAKTKRYSKETYADVSNITTISKLRVTKFSENNLSENTYASTTSIQQIKKSLNNLI